MSLSILGMWSGLGGNFFRAVVLELAGVLLLLAMVGAIAIARKKFPPSPDHMPEEKLIIGQRGKTAAPF